MPGLRRACGFDEDQSFYDDYDRLDFGLMVHGFDYPDETGRNMLALRLWRAHMEKGVIRFRRPGNATGAPARHPPDAEKGLREDGFSP
jgi:CRISPR-associated protein Cas5d